MANLRAIRTRIKSVESTRQITKSMKMVAAAKLRRTQGAFQALQVFSEACGKLLREVSADSDARLGQVEGESHSQGKADTGSRPEEAGAEFPRSEGSARKKILYVLLVGNRGLCGVYNQALLRYCEKLVKERTEAPAGAEAGLMVCGRWGKDQIAASGLPVRETLDISDTPTREEALALAGTLKQRVLDGEADEVVLVYQQYRSVLSQTPGCKTLLPLPAVPLQNDGGEWIFEPNRETVVNTLQDMVLTNTLHAALLEARTGEHSARMTAMTAASDNTEELIGKLTLELNHARQAAITTEITEIASGAEALRNSQAGG